MVLALADDLDDQLVRLRVSPGLQERCGSSSIVRGGDERIIVPRTDRVADTPRWLRRP